MPTPEQEILAGRKKRTLLLLAGGGASLILPLLGIAYIRMNEAKTARAPNSSVMFDRRENGETKVNVSQTVAIVNPPVQTGTASPPPAGGAPSPRNGSSLDFVKSGANNAYFQENAAAPAPSTPTTPAETAAVPEPEPVAKAAVKKSGKKPFNTPKLQGTKGFTSFKGAPQKAQKVGDDMADLLKNGADDAAVQQYLKSQGN